MNKAQGYVIIHDLSDRQSLVKYIVHHWTDAYDDTDRSAAQEAFRTHQTIEMGKVIAEYHP